MILHQYLTDHQALGYAIVFLGMILEGEIILFTAAFLISQGYFNAGLMFVLVFSGALIGDTVWYYFGKLVDGQKSFPRFKKFTEKITSPVDEHLKNRPIKTLFISKFAWGINRPVILKSGVLKIPFGKFIKADFAAALAWIFFVGALGYLSGASFSAAKRYLKYSELTLLMGIAIFILVDRVVAKISKKEL
ncbi:DedA family protein [Candidatus Azambacteria bacterium]|nr:DedA family protein [Candidatus Azambacteria bacterium]